MSRCQRTPVPCQRPPLDHAILLLSSDYADQTLRSASPNHSSSCPVTTSVYSLGLQISPSSSKNRNSGYCKVKKRFYKEKRIKSKELIFKSKNTEYKKERKNIIKTRTRARTHTHIHAHARAHTHTHTLTHTHRRARVHTYTQTITPEFADCVFVLIAFF